MTKITWWRRLFMRWETLVAYINQDANNALQTKEAESAAAARVFQAQIDGLQATLQEREAHVRDLQAQVTRLTTDLARLTAEKTARDEALQKAEAQQNEERANFREQNERLRTQINMLTSNNEKIQQDIANKLKTLTRIEQTFFATTGNKGKGNLGELQLESMLTSSNVPADLYTKTLLVGSTQVEFAIRATAPDAEVVKWIPVDSKVVEAPLDPEGNSVVDENFARRVLAQAKEVAKYVGKKNTTNFGLLVLQSDELYIKLFSTNKAAFDEAIKTHKVHIVSPSFFIQFAWALSQLLDIYTMVQKDERMYEEIRDLLTSVQKFALSVNKAHEQLNKAITLHFPTMERRGNHLITKFNRDQKLKPIATGKVLSLDTTEADE